MIAAGNLGAGLDRVITGARHYVGDVRVSCRLGEHAIGVPAKEAGTTGRRDAERARKGVAEDRLRLVARRNIDEVARQQLVLVKRRGIGFEAALVLDAALDKIKGDLGQPPFCHAVQIFDIDGLVDPHGIPLQQRARRAALSISPAPGNAYSAPRGGS